MSSESMVFERVGNTFVLLHTRAPPTEEVWSRYMDAFRACGDELPSMRVLVFTDGGGPTAHQRRVMTELVAGRTFPVAIVSDAAAVRFIVSTLALFAAEIRTFGVRSLSAALAHIGVVGAEEQEVRRAAARLSELAGGSCASATLAIR